MELKDVLRIQILNFNSSCYNMLFKCVKYLAIYFRCFRAIIVMPLLEGLVDKKKESIKIITMSQKIQATVILNDIKTVYKMFLCC